MTRKEFEALVLDTYNIKADYPFEEDFVTGVFRHEGSGKWFAVAMNIPRVKLGLSGDENIDIVNFKCAPEVIESIAGIEPGIYRAYHMNKIHWLTVCLEECDADTILWLMGISYDLTRTKIRKVNKSYCRPVDVENNFDSDMTDDEKIDLAAARILEEYRTAFEELAK